MVAAGGGGGPNGAGAGNACIPYAPPPPITIPEKKIEKQIFLTMFPLFQIQKCYNFLKLTLSSPKAAHITIIIPVSNDGKNTTENTGRHN